MILLRRLDSCPARLTEVGKMMESDSTQTAFDPIDFLIGCADVVLHIELVMAVPEERR